MIEIRIHGRGGQGAVVASKILAAAVFRAGRYVQSFPEFGVERRGAPVQAYTRIDDRPVRMRCKIYEPDHIIVLDPTLVQMVDVTSGLAEGGMILVNTDRPPESFTEFAGYEVSTVDASGIAVAHGLGSRTSPIVSTAIIGAFARASGVVGLEALCEAVREESPARKDANVEATKAAYEAVVLSGSSAAAAGTTS